MNDKIQLKRGTLANWLKADPVLADGEMALVATDASKPTVYDSQKVGDGTHKFSELEMLGYKCLQELGDSQQFPMSQKAITDWVNKGYQFRGVATPSTNPGTPDGPVFYFATKAGIYANFNSISVADGEVVILQWDNGAWTKKTTGFAAEQEIIYDVSARNDGAVFESLQALLSSSNLSDLIPTSVRCGGMSIRFIQGSVPNSDNKYVQYRLMATSFSTNEADWQGVDEQPTAGSDNLVKSSGVFSSISAETARAKIAEQAKLNKTELPIKNVEEPGVYFVDEKGNAFMIYSNEKGLDVSKISQEMANKVLVFLAIKQELGDSSTSVISQKAVTDAITNIKITSEVAEDGAFLCNEKGEVFARFVNGKFEAVGMEFPKTNVENLEDIKNVTGGSSGQFLQKQSNGKWAGASISFPQPILSGLTDVDVNPVEGSILQYRSGKWVNAEISTEGMVTTDSRSNHPMYGKHFFVFGDSHTADGFGLWKMLCELTGAIYHTLLRKKASDGTYHFFSATTSTTDYSLLIDEEDTGIEVNCDGFNWAQYAHAAYTYAQSKGFNVDYILVENCHFGKWNFYNDDGSVKENAPIVLLNKTKVYSQIFENAMAVMNFVSKDENIAKVVDELGFDSIDSSFDLRYGTASQELVFSFSNGNTLSTDCVAKIHFGDDTSKIISTTLSSGMSLTDCVDAINQWAFNEYSTWINPSKGTQGNTKILLNYSSEVGGDSSTIANFEVTNSANLVMQQPSISVKATSWIHEYGLKDTSGLRKSSSWLRTGGNINWSLPNAMLGAMQYIGKYSPKTKFVFLGIWNNSMQEDYIYEDGSVNPYDLMKSSSYKGGQISKKSIKDIAELFGWQYIDVDKLCGITPFNVTPTFNDYNNVHMKKDGYRVSAECIAKYIK